MLTLYLQRYCTPLHPPTAPPPTSFPPSLAAFFSIDDCAAVTLLVRSSCRCCCGWSLSVVVVPLSRCSSVGRSRLQVEPRVGQLEAAAAAADAGAHPVRLCVLAGASSACIAASGASSLRLAPSADFGQLAASPPLRVFSRLVAHSTRAPSC